MGTWLLRSLAAIAGFLVLSLAVYLHRAPDSLVGIDAPPSTSGGCAPSSSPYLKQDRAVLTSAISFCAKGDADTGTVLLKIPANALAANRLVVAGYLDGRAVRLSIRRSGPSPPISIVVRAGEAWLDVTHRIPEAWRAEPMEARLDDFGTAHTQWGGIGLLGGRPADRSEPAPMLLLACFLFGMALLAPTAPPSSGTAAVSGGALGLAGPRHWPPMVIGALVVLALGTAFYHTPSPRTNFTPPPHPDQIIPVKVMQSMRLRGDWDTDWGRADLPTRFLGFGYNFSGYILSSYLLIDNLSPRSINDDRLLAQRLRTLSCGYSALTLAICFLLLASQLNLGYAFAGTLAVSLIPQLVQDAHYVRPEALSTLLFTGCFALSAWRPRAPLLRWLTLAVVAGMCGFLASIKFTYAVAGIFAPVAALPLLGENGIRTSKSPTLFGIAALIVAAFLAGFAIGAPRAIANLPTYMQGVAALNQQYGGGHPPHMTMRGGTAGQAWLIWSYYTAVLGIPALLLHLVGYRGKRLAPSKFAYAAVLAFTVAGFLTQKVFFERNFSLLLPTFIVIAMLGIANVQEWVARFVPPRNSAGRIALAAIAAVLFVSVLYRSMPITLRLFRHFTPAGQAEVEHKRDGAVQASKESIGATRVEWLPYRQVHAGKYPEPGGECVLYGVFTYNDDWSALYLRRMPARLRVLGHVPSDFGSIPVSTLHIYHSPAIYLFADEQVCPASRTIPSPRR